MRTLSSLMVVVLCGSAAAGGIVSVSYGSLTGDLIEGFEGFDDGTGFEGANYEGVVTNGLGLLFGERFAGQSVGNGTNQSGNGVHDVIGGDPSGGLNPVAGAAFQNSVVGDTTPFGGSGHAIGGLSSVGWPDFQAIGEGAMCVLFEVDQPDVGFGVFGDTGPGDLRIAFFARDGSVLGSVTIDEVSNGSYGFATDDGSASIAGILLTNTEDEGIAYDNIRYHSVPTPGAACLPLACIAAWRRRCR